MSKKAATISFFETFQSTHNSLNVHEENTIYWAIMYDDIKLFISFTERESFDANMALVSDYYPITGNVYSLLELCCYYGSVNCFKFLRTEFNLQINHTCLEFSFLGGKPDIMNECLKYQTPDQNCMVLAIASHNIDFVTFLMNEYDLKIDLSACIKFNNLQAFFVYLDQTKDLNECYILSPSFHIPSICEYFLENNVKIDATDSENEKTALHNAAYYNCVEVMQFLLSHGLCVEEKSKYLKTPLHFAAENNSIESVEFLLSNGAKIDARAYYMETPLHYACNYNCIETVKLLILNGANINAKTKQSKTALHFAVKNNCKNIVNILITYGISLNIRDKSRKTAL
ncbi:ankyrin repeat protein, putative [Trichomonas vaginalis G3]|uniref:Ankyrin repeat protein, putative n=1 Tax=Trichomonas vaginalis (strain ATCC PRA-98 / G3) TaxID=412133 RepID=A2EWP0_TRIV3|nr:spectrin binding [Trichomonas vaginalis G3]EAY02928.1 ankyrin repeat protein, putative [Trichomonas vaginalis G3]KAI5521778.1 spectrin binding [Trichomonas vaginalis G3]|eukprot:XP_001315151.1 ankyrin repeat protein [Trichomonas vaginalis G3]